MLFFQRMAFITLITFSLIGFASAPGTIDDRGVIDQLSDKATSQIEANQLEQASETLERALRLAPKDAALWGQLGSLRQLEGKSEQAEAMFEKSRQLSGDLAMRQDKEPYIVAPIFPSEVSPNDRNYSQGGVARSEQEQYQDRNAYADQSHSAYRESESFTQREPNRYADRYSYSDRPEYEPYRDNWEGGFQQREYAVSSNQFRSRPRPIHAFNSVQIPAGQLPPPGYCRIWFPELAVGNQPPPGDCYELEQQIPANAILLSR